MTTVEIVHIIVGFIEIILFLVFIGFVFALTKLVKLLIEKVGYLQGEFEKIRDKVNPILETVNEKIGPIGDSVKELTDKVNDISDKVNDSVGTVRDSVDKLKDTVDDIIEFERRIQRQVETPINDTIYAYSAIVNAVKAFVDKYKSFGFKTKKKQSTYENYDYANSEGAETDFGEDRELKEVNRRIDSVR